VSRREQLHTLPERPSSSSSSSSSSIYFGQRPGTRSHNTRFGPILAYKGFLGRTYMQKGAGKRDGRHNSAEKQTKTHPK
jgi:hypothetical protein